MPQLMSYGFQFRDSHFSHNSIIQMGNQLCPANNKEIISNFKDIEKGDRSVSELVASYLAHNKQQNQSYISNDLENRSEISFVPILKFKPQAILEALQNEEQVPHAEITHNSEPSFQTKRVDNFELQDGWTYTGYIMRGVPEGEGEQISPSGDVYKGTFKNGQKQGMGVYQFSNNAIYRGQFKENLMWGEGTFEFANGDKFQGQFVRNVREGKGKYIPRQPNIDGILYFEGQYHNDKKEGPGKMVYEHGTIEGMWKNGVYDFQFAL